MNIKEQINKTKKLDYINLIIGIINFIIIVYLLIKTF